MILDRIRRLARSRVAPLLVLGAVLIFGARTCDKEPARVEVTFDFGAAAGRVRTLHADVFRGDQVASVAYFDADYAGGAPHGRPWALQLNPGSYRLQLIVTTGAGTRTVERHIQAEDRARITVALEDELIAEPQPKP